MIHPILEFLEEEYGYAPPSHIYSPILEARAWWGGMWEPFHAATEHHTGMAPRRREMYKMGMAKKVCEDWATVLCNDKTLISTGDTELDRVLLGERHGMGGILTQGNIRPLDNRIRALVRAHYIYGDLISFHIYLFTLHYYLFTIHSMAT